MATDTSKPQDAGGFLGNDKVLSPIQWMGEQVPGGFFIYRADDSQEMLYVNGATLRIFGCDTLEEFKQLTGYTFRGLVHADDFERIQASIDEQIADAANKNMDYVEYRIVRKDGSVRWVDDYGHFAQLPGYGDVYYVFIGDITEKHQAQEENLRRVNVYAGMMEQFNALADDSLTVFRSNLTTGIIQEARGKDLYPCDHPGGLLADSVDARLQSFFSDRDRQEYQRVFRLDTLIDRYYKGLGPASFVAYCRRASGRQCFVRFSGSAVVDPVSGDTIAFGTETEYNSERVEEVLNEKVLAQQYDMVCYLVGDHYGVVIGDAAHIKRGSIFPKHASGSYSAYIAEQVLPVYVETDRSRQELARALSPESVREALATEGQYVVDVTCSIDGELVNKRFTFYPVDKDADFYILLKSDVTDVLREQRERNELLASALREAEQANAAKTAFLSNMSHEIRTPMNAIIGYGNIALKDTSLSSQTRDYLQKIDRSAKHLLGLINDILDMSRIESGRMTMRHEEFSLRDMLDQICTMVQSQCGDKGLTFVCHVDSRMSDRYVGDDMRLKQVIINILSNAVKFTSAPGEVTLVVRRVAAFDNQTTVRFVVRDTGIGMDQDFLPRIFDTFSQENMGKSNKYGSTGLGMAITKNIVDMMNGTIQVRSTKGVGSEFTVTVTLGNGTERDEPRAGSAADRPVPSPAIDLAGRHILLAEDVDINAEIMQQLLGMRSLQVDRAENGQVALDMFRQSTQGYYDAVLMDVRMPVMDGLEATATLRALDRADARTVPIIALTANAFDEDVKHSLQAGMSAHLSKPVEIDQLFATLERLIDERNKNDEDWG